MTRICLIQGHPTAAGQHYCHALAAAYSYGATRAGHEVKSVVVAELEFPLLRSKQDWDKELPPKAIADAQACMRWAQHVVIVHPLWIGAMPALLKGFFEQLLRPGFAMAISEQGGWTKLLTGRTAHVIVTMGMPAVIYRWYFGAHGLKSLTQNLSLVGIKPTRSTLIGRIEAMSDASRGRWLNRLRALGERAS